MTAKNPPKAFSVIYNWHGEPARAIFLTKDKALDYVAKYSLYDAILKPMYYEEDFEGGVGCIARPSVVTLESVEKDGVVECVSASTALSVLPEK